MHTLPETLVVRPVTMDDFEAVVELMTTSLRAKNAESNISVASVRSTWQQIDLETCTWAIVTHLGKIVAFASLDARAPSYMQVTLVVAPDHDEEGMDAFLMRILEDRARRFLPALPAGKQAILQRRVSVSPEHLDKQASRAYLDRAGFQLIQHFWQMEITLTAPSLMSGWPAGVAWRHFQRGQDEEATLQVFVEAFREQGPGEVEYVTRVSRLAMSDPTLDTSMWYVVTSDKKMVGAAFCETLERKGWVTLIGVLPAWRRKGIGTGLLQQIFHDFYQRGIRQVGLNVDKKNPDGAISFYQNIGMNAVQHMLIYEKILR